MSFVLQTIQQPETEVSPQQKKLNRLIDQIEQQKLDLEKWKNAQDQIQQQIRLKLLPLYTDLHQLQFQQLEFLWTNVQSHDLTKSEQQQLDDSTARMAKTLTQAKCLNTIQMETVQKIDVFYRQLNMQKTISKVQQSCDIPTLQQASNTDFDELDAFEYEEWDSDKFQQQREQAKLKKQQEKREHAAKMAEQSLKTVYLKITAMIHPDREPDDAKKVEKTELLQVVNEAYQSQDLFYLLKLQLQLELNKDIMQKPLSADQIKFYKLALEGQSQKLELQIKEIIASFHISTKVQAESDVYKAIDGDVKSLKQHVKWEKERLKYMGKVQGLKMLLEQNAL